MAFISRSLIIALNFAFMVVGCGLQPNGHLKCELMLPLSGQEALSSSFSPLDPSLESQLSHSLILEHLDHSVVVLM